MSGDRPAPEAFLAAARAEGRGRLKVFLGAAPGVGKTYEMLSDGAARLKSGEDVVGGVVETHGRAETEALTRPFEIVPRRAIEYQGRTLTEMDIDAVLARRAGAGAGRRARAQQRAGQPPSQALSGCRGADRRRHRRVHHGQHPAYREPERRRRPASRGCGCARRCPTACSKAPRLEVVDIPPDELIDRLKAGKVYVPDEASRALGHFFSKPNLQALRELALRRAAQTVDAQMLDHLRAHALAGNFAVGERDHGRGQRAALRARIGARGQSASPTRCMRRGRRSTSRRRAAGGWAKPTASGWRRR